MGEHTGRSVAIALVTAMSYVVWPSVLVIGVWLSLTIYAIVKWIGSPTDHASPLTVVLIVIADVAVFVLALAIGIWLLGKPMRYGKRKRREAEQLALAFAGSGDA